MSWQAWLKPASFLIYNSRLKPEVINIYPVGEGCSPGSCTPTRTKRFFKGRSTASPQLLGRSCTTTSTKCFFKGRSPASPQLLERSCTTTSTKCFFKSRSQASPQLLGRSCTPTLHYTLFQGITLSTLKNFGGLRPEAFKQHHPSPPLPNV